MPTSTFFDHAQASAGASMHAPWMPLDALVERWAAFGKEARTAAATRASGEAFAALAEERDALHAYNRLDEHQAGAMYHAHRLNRYEYILESLSLAATHWFNAACALGEDLEQGPWDGEENTTIEQDLQTLIGQAFTQRERVWSIALAVLHEQVQDYQAWNGSIEVASVLVQEDAHHE